MVALSLWAIVSQSYAFGAEFGSDALSVGDKTAMSENVPRTDTELLNTLWTAVLDRDAGFQKMLKESDPHELEQIKKLSSLNVLLEGRREELRPIDSLFHSPNCQLLGKRLHQKSDRLYRARNDAHACRLSLCDMAGEDTVAKLDKGLKFNTGFLDSMDGLKAVDQFLHGDRKVLRGYMQPLWLIHQA